MRGGTYTLATASDDGSLVYVDGQLVVDNGGGHKTQLKSSARTERTRRRMSRSRLVIRPVRSPPTCEGNSAGLETSLTRVLA